MKTFNNLEEMKPYYNKKTNTYEFFENGEIIDIHINFILKTTKSICAKNINASNIKAWDIYAKDIDAWKIDAVDIKICEVCDASETFVCKIIKCSEENAKYFCLDSDVVIKQDM